MLLICPDCDGREFIEIRIPEKITFRNGSELEVELYRTRCVNCDFTFVTPDQSRTNSVIIAEERFLIEIQTPHGNWVVVRSDSEMYNDVFSDYEAVNRLSSGQNVDILDPHGGLRRTIRFTLKNPS